MSTLSFTLGEEFLLSIDSLLSVLRGLLEVDISAWRDFLPGTDLAASPVPLPFSGDESPLSEIVLSRGLDLCLLLVEPVELILELLLLAVLLTLGVCLAL